VAEIMAPLVFTPAFDSIVQDVDLAETRMQFVDPLA
jgi:hypothetical protein